jgi:hypothetical protein
MSNDERIAQIEKDLAEIKPELVSFGKMYEYEIGRADAFHAAIIALIAAHPDPDEVAKQVRQHVARPEAASVFGQGSEERLNGLQDAQAYLAEVCSIAQKLHRMPR